MNSFARKFLPCGCDEIKQKNMGKEARIQKCQVRHLPQLRRQSPRELIVVEEQLNIVVRCQFFENSARKRIVGKRPAQRELVNQV